MQIQYEIEGGIRNINANANEDLSDNQIANVSNVGLCLFDYENGVVEKRFPEAPVFSKKVTCRLSKERLVTYDSGSMLLTCFTYDMQDLWSVDLIGIGEKRYNYWDIYELCMFKNKVFVFVQASVFIFDLETGALLKIIKDCKIGVNIKIEGNICYFSNIAYFNALDMDSLEMLSSFEYPDLLIDGKPEWVFGGDFTLKDGKIWFCGDCGDKNMVFCMDPITGEYLWHDTVKDSHVCMAPIFIDERMYILDKYKEGGKLHVYEKN